MPHKPIRYKYQGGRVLPHCGITHLLCLKMIMDTVQVLWVYFNPLNTHFLSFTAFRNKENTAGLIRITSFHISCVLRWSGTWSSAYSSLRIASLHISFVLRWLEISIIQRGTAIFIYIFWPREGQILWTGHFEVVDVKTYQIVKNDYLLLPQFFCLFFLVLWHAPIPPPWWMTSNKH